MGEYTIKKNEVVEKTLELIDKKPIEWNTFNEKLNTYVIDENHLMQSDILLEDGEEPILECILDDSFMLITTKRLISNFSNNYSEMLINEIIGFGNEFEESNYKMDNNENPKTNLIVVNGSNEKKIILKIDSYEPAYFAKLLITNLSYYAKNGVWFWKPRKW